MLLLSLLRQKGINFSDFCVSRCLYYLYSANMASISRILVIFDAFIFSTPSKKHLFLRFLCFSMLFSFLPGQKGINFSDFCVSRCFYILYSVQKASGFIIFVGFDAFYPINGFGRYSIRNIRFEPSSFHSIIQVLTGPENKKHLFIY